MATMPSTPAAMRAHLTAEPPGGHGMTMADMPMGQMQQRHDAAHAGGAEHSHATRSADLGAMNVRSGDLWVDNPLEVRATEDGTGLLLDGYAVRFGSPSLPMHPMQIAEPASRASFSKFRGAPRFREVVHEGALTKTLAENPDITLRYQHNMMSPPLGRTSAGTLRLASDGAGLHVLGDLPDNTWGRDLSVSVARRDITGMSVRFGVPAKREDWQIETFADGWSGPVRHIHEMKLGPEISLVDFPAFTATSASVRALADDLGVEPDEIEAVFEVIRDPSGRLTPDQKDLFVAAIKARTDEPLISKADAEKLASMRERLPSLAG